MPRLSRFLVALGCISAVSANAEPSTYVLASKGQAQIKFTVDAPLDTITGISTGLVGAAQWEVDSGALTARMVCDLNGFQTGIQLRDEDLRDQFFETAKFPIATLEVTGVKWKEPPSASTKGTGVATGTLNLHGVSRKIEFPISVQGGKRADKAALWVNGSFDVKFADYNIARPKRLFLKLGDTAQVTVNATLVSNAPAQAVATAAAAPVELPADAQRAVLVVAQVEKEKPKPPAFKFAATTSEGKGERLFARGQLGGAGNSLKCQSCHSVVDERAGFTTGKHIKPSRSLFNVAKRPTLWQGLSKNVGMASSLCARLFMVNSQGLNEEQQAQLTAYLTALSPDDTVPGLDYEVMALTRRSDLAKPTAGNAKAGEQTTEKFCGDCHAKGKIRPPLTPGLYEADYLVRRVRWLPGHDAHQMPPMYVDRLTDTDLRNIVSYLSGDKSKRIFERRRGAPEKPATQSSNQENP